MGFRGVTSAGFLERLVSVRLRGPSACPEGVPFSAAAAAVSLLQRPTAGLQWSR